VGAGFSGKSRMSGDVHVRFRERLRGRFPGATRLVILCPKGKGEEAMGIMRRLMGKLGLTVNEKKTRLVKLPDETFDFLGYTVGQFHGRAGRPYWGTRPSKKSIKRLMREVHDATTRRWDALNVQSRIDRLNPLLRGWAGYFSQGPVKRIYRTIDNYVARRLRIWLMRKHGKKGTGYRQYSDQFLYETLGLIRLLPANSDRSNAKV
jgi:RNA-directed DNA polymerase